MNMISNIQKQRFLSKLTKDENGCLIWQGAIIRGGYGSLAVHIDGKKQHFTAHRFALILHTGEDKKNYEACHQPLICKNRACCNPEHLRWDTHKSNCADMKIVGTLKIPNIRGEDSHYAKLKENDVKEIRRLRAEEKMKYKEIATIFGLKERSISDIILRKSWKHIL